MEISDISPDVLSITGILVNAKAKFGDLSNIIYKGLKGDEEKVAYVLQSLISFLKSKNYIDDDNTPKLEFSNYFKELSLLLIVNTEFSKSFNIDEYAHLTYNIPKVSKYLLAKVVVALKITEYFCMAVEKLPLLYSCELFTEFILCLDKVEFQQMLTDTDYILSTIGKIILNNQDSKHCDEMDILLQTVPEFFFRLSRISVEQLPSLKKKLLFVQAGYVLQRLFNLLFFCNENNMLNGVFIDKLIESTTNVVRCVSLDMFLYWCEIDLDNGQNLQGEIAEKAYVIIEKYQHFKPAAEMTQSLKPLASKPKSFKDQLQTADIDKMVLMINRADENQKKWFDALIFSSFLSNEKAVECVSKWYHLCKEEDVSKILNLSIKENHKEAKKLALKCSSVLDLPQLILVVTRHFYKNGFVVLHNNVQSELVFLFNMMKDSENMKENIVIELLLLILKNPEATITFVTTECLRSVFYVSVLEDCFSKLKYVLSVNNIGLNCLQKAIDTLPPSNETIESYVKLLQLFLDIQLLTNDSLITKIVNPTIGKYVQDENIEDLKQILSILNVLNISIQPNEIVAPFLENLFEILGCRTQFMNHKSSTQAVIQEVVKIIKHKIRSVADDLPILAENPEDDKFVAYYKKCICSLDNISLLQNLVGDYSLDNRTKTVCQLMQVLPSCVTEEWISICAEILHKTSCRYLLNLINNMMILLCEFTKNQETSENYPNLVEALKYCIHQLGIVIQNTVLSTNNFIEDEVIVTEILIELLSHLPASIKEIEGLNLLSIMTERSLKNLGQDKKFVARICRIKDTKICQILAQKILG